MDCRVFLSLIGFIGFIYPLGLHAKMLKLREEAIFSGSSYSSFDSKRKNGYFKRTHLKRQNIGRVVDIERFDQATWLQIQLLNGQHVHKRVWVPFQKKELNIRVYGLQDQQMFQTREPLRAAFVVLDANFKGYIDKLDKNKWKPSEVDFFAQFPRSNFGIREIANKEMTLKSCPKHPRKRDGKACPYADRAKRIPRYLKRVIRKVAKKHRVHPALLTAVVHKESKFNPFTENTYEKSLCEQARKKGESCPSYKWGQGLSQLGATNAAKYGLRWMTKIRKPKACGRKHMFQWRCFSALEKQCRKDKKRYGKSPSYCPSASINAVAKLLAELKYKKREAIVEIRKTDGSWSKEMVNLNKIMFRNTAEEFRYIVGMYNRGMRPLNSIEEHFRQFGRAPKWYDEAWTTPRKERTLSSQMGFYILHEEMINRCHVWQLAGLCGNSLKGTLTGQYLKVFPK